MEKHFKREANWNEYETAILLEAYLKYINGKCSRKDTIKNVSMYLRKMAQNQNIEIDDIYRNENGITFQLYSMETAYLGYTFIKPAPKIFRDVVDLYNNNREVFDNILRKAWNMINNKEVKEKIDDEAKKNNLQENNLEANKDNIQKFTLWFSKQVSPILFSDLFVLYKVIDDFCLSRKISTNPILETTDINVVKLIKRAVESNKIFRYKNNYRIKKINLAMNYYYKYVKEINEENIKQEIIKSAIKTEDQKEKIQNVNTKINNKIVDKSSENDFTNKLSKEKTNLAYTKPIYVSLFGKEINNISSWRQLYVSVFSELYEDYKFVIPVNKSFYGGNNRMDFCTTENYNSMQRPQKIVHDRYLETNLSATDVVRKIKSLLEICNIDSKKLIIKYRKINKVNEIKNVNKNDKPNTSLSNSSQPSLLNCEDISLEKYKQILVNKFGKGYRLGSAIELRKFKRFWEEIYGEPLKLEDKDIERNIQNSGIVYEKKLYMPQLMLDEETKDKLFAYIDNCFMKGEETIYYEPLFNHFSNDFLGHYIFNPEMLFLYLSFINDGKYNIRKDYIAKEYGVNVSLDSQVKNCLKNSFSPLTKEKLAKSLPNIPQNKIELVISRNDDIISNGKEEYFHISNVLLDDVDLCNISSIIKNTVDDRKFISGNELIDTIKQKYPNIIDNNSVLTDRGLRNSIKYYLKDKFSFKGNIISLKGEQISMAGVFKDFCMKRSSFTLDELKKLKNELETTIYFDVIYDNSLRISKNNFVSKERATFQINETDAAIDRYCIGNYISIEKIEQFSFFPDAGFSWNSFLLEHYVARYSLKYKLLHSNYNENKCVGGIVKKDSKINTFDDLLIDVLANSSVELNKENSIQYLCDMGYLARRSCSNMELLLIKAKELRNQKGN